MGFDQRKLLIEQVELATPAERLMMIWDRLMLNVGQARQAMEAGDHEAANSQLIAAQQILVILSNTLDHSWEGAANLDALYRWCWERLVTANVKWDHHELESAARTLSKLYDAWAQAAADAMPAIAS